jgi:hypothetical protein
MSAHSAYPREVYFESSLPAKLSNIGLRWKWLTVKNTVAYYDMDKIKTVKKFLCHLPLDQML